MAFVVKSEKTPRWKVWLLTLLGVAASGCAGHREMVMARDVPQTSAPGVLYIVDPLAGSDNIAGTTDAWPLNATRLPNVALDLQRCADSLANGEKETYGNNFRMVRLNTDGLLRARMNDYVGSQYVSNVQDGNGEWYGRRVYRKVDFHCLQDQNGRVVYAFLRQR